MHAATLPSRGRRLVALLLVATGALAVGPGAATPSASAAGPTSGATYVALGDSYAAGEGLGPFEPGTDVPPIIGSADDNIKLDKNMCHRSLSDAYGSLHATTFTVLPDVPADRRALWACSGARAADMTRSQGDYDTADDHYQYGEPSQLSRVGTDTRWISLSAGGNDVQFANMIATCGAYSVGSAAFRFPKPQARSADSINEALPRTCSKAIAYAAKRLEHGGNGPGDLRPVLVNLYRALLDRAPDAQLSVVGYPRVLPTSYDKAPHTSPRICATNKVTAPSATFLPHLSGPSFRAGFLLSDVKTMNAEVIGPLADTIRGAVREIADDPQYAGRIAYVDAAAVTKAHDCSGKNTHASVNGFMLSLKNGDPSVAHGFISTATFHPNRDGQVAIGAAVARSYEFNDHHNRLGWTASPAGLGPLVIGTGPGWPRRLGLIEPTDPDEDGCVQSNWQDTALLVDPRANPDAGTVSANFEFDDSLHFVWVADPDFPTTKGIRAGATVAAVKRAYPRVKKMRVGYEGTPVSVLSEQVYVQTSGDHFLIFTRSMYSSKRIDAILIGDGEPRLPPIC